PIIVPRPERKPRLLIYDITLNVNKVAPPPNQTCPRMLCRSLQEVLDGHRRQNVIIVEWKNVFPRAVPTEKLSGTGDPSIVRKVNPNPRISFTLDFIQNLTRLLIPAVPQER